MFKHILVPLDGSHLAESALKPTAELAQRLGATVTLLHIIEKNVSADIHGDHHLTNQDEACEYLGRLTEKAFPPQVEVENHVHTEEVRDVARSISEHATEYAPDLIVMCTHGKGGLRDRVAGSIAQQVINLGKTPVLLLQPDEAGGVYVTFDRFLVALDTNPEHQSAIEIAGGFAVGMKADLHLVNVVQTPDTLSGNRAAVSRLMPATTVAMLEMAEEYAREYLDEQAGTWRAKGLRVTARVRRGDVAKELASEVARADCHLIVLGTHGRKGMDAFWSGSVAPRVAGQLRIPLLLVPVGRD